ncbi:MAG: hypothetical protein EZS26_001961 [Candidatus Ordinivivax streblomastigis]|uniref:Uncharacterized protein n=1 Tax=Candidatus Ordinivivax streblomastigis TaxID=2540710 RepID=A0A5M8P0N8_9BACT|nr:MAG: hypothetical protein EZS26_001961 [Candidatus Ordinivivax streblomastigis]
MGAKVGDILFVERHMVQYKSPKGGSPSILVSMSNWQGGNPVRAEWNGSDVYVYPEKGWIYKMKNGSGSPTVFSHP